MSKNVRRRDFLQLATGGAGFATFPSAAFSQTPAQRVGVTQDDEGVAFHPLEDGQQLMVGSPPHPKHRVTIDNYTDSVAKTRWAQQHTDVVFKTAQISRGTGPSRQLKRRTIDTKKLARQHVSWIDSDGNAKPTRLDKWLTESKTDAIVVLHKGQIVIEQYFGSATPDLRHILWSAGKGLLACLAFQALASGDIREDTPARSIVDELSKGFDGVTVRHLLDQSCGLNFKMFPSPSDPQTIVDQYTFATPDYRRAPGGMPKFSRMAGVLPLAAYESHNEGLYDFLFAESRRAKKLRNHGASLWYSVLNELTLQLILERKAKRPFGKLLGENLWSKLGAEHSAYAIVDSLGTVTNSGLAVTARDAARFGQMILERGRVGQRPIVPGRVINDMLKNRNEMNINDGSNMKGIVPDGTGYRGMFWSYPNDKVGSPFLNSVGFMSQHCFIDPLRNNVIVKFSSNLDLAGIAPDIVALKSLSRLVPRLV